MPTRTLIVLLAIGASACTGGSASTDTASPSPTPSPLPTSNVAVRIVPGVWTYELRGLKATFTWKDSPATLSLDNGAGIDLGAPAIYVVTQDQGRVDATVEGAAPLGDGATGDYTVTFPGDLMRDDIGLVVLELGGVNWGALSPKVIESSGA